MSTPAAWHPDPTGRHDHRWWDGEKWTEHVADAGQASVDPLDAGPPAGAGGDAAGAGWAGEATGGDTGATASTGSADAAGDAGTAGDGSAASGDAAAGTSGPGTTAGSDTGDVGSAAGSAAGAWQTPGSDTPATGTDPAGDATEPIARPDAQQAWNQPDAGSASGQWGQPTGQPAGQPAAPWAGQQGWPQSSAAAGPPPTGNDGVALAAMIVGILSLLISFLVIPALGGVIAIILGIVGRNRIKQSGQGGNGMAITGIVTGSLSIVVAILVVIAIGAFWSTAGGVFNSYFECLDETGGDTEFCDQQLEEGLIDRFG